MRIEDMIVALVSAGVYCWLMWSGARIFSGGPPHQDDNRMTVHHTTIAEEFQKLDRIVFVVHLGAIAIVAAYLWLLGDTAKGPSLTVLLVMMSLLVMFSLELVHLLMQVIACFAHKLAPVRWVVGSAAGFLLGFYLLLRVIQII